MARYLEYWTKPQSRVIALVACVLLLLVALSYQAFEWHALNAAAIEDAYEQLDRYKAISSQRYQKTDARQLGELRTEFLPGQTEALIGAELQSRLSMLINENRCELSTSRILPMVVREGQSLIGLRAQMQCDMANFHNLIYAIETSTPFLIVKRTQLRLAEQSNRSKQEVAVAWTAAEIDIYGAVWPQDNTEPTVKP